MSRKQSAIIYSLTEPGRALGIRLLEAVPSSVHKHRANPFIETVQNDFTQGHDCIFICAIGIVIRALAPVLRDKYRDPAVVALDESGDHVIPLLSGHQGGADALARRIAERIGGRCVITSAGDYGQPVYTLGIGCDRNCPVEMINELLNKASAVLDSGESFCALASIDRKADEPCLLATAADLTLPFRTWPAQRLRSVEDQLTEKSETVFREVGCYGVAEAAALIAAAEITGNRAELVLPKQKNARATIAVARSYRTEGLV